MPNNDTIPTHIDKSIAKAEREYKKSIEKAYKEYARQVEKARKELDILIGG